MSVFGGHVAQRVKRPFLEAVREREDVRSPMTPTSPDMKRPISPPPSAKITNFDGNEVIREMREEIEQIRKEMEKTKRENEITKDNFNRLKKEVVDYTKNINKYVEENIKIGKGEEWKGIKERVDMLERRIGDIEITENELNEVVLKMEPMVIRVYEKAAEQQDLIRDFFNKYMEYDENDKIATEDLNNMLINYATKRGMRLTVRNITSTLRELYKIKRGHTGNDYYYKNYRLKV